MTLNEDSELALYMSDGQKDLLHVGFHLLDEVKSDRTSDFEDYSFVVFPFAKAFEGFLKQAFLDAGFITREEFVSKYFRIGKAMSPNLVKKFGDKSVYKKICDKVSCEISESIWHTWKVSRNEVFHYFPHNVRSLDLQEAEQRIDLIMKTMEVTVKELRLQKD